MPEGISNSDLAGIVDTAAAIFNPQDSEEPIEAEEQPEEVEEQAEDDLDEDGLDELDDVDLDDDQELEEDDEDSEDDSDEESDEDDDLEDDEDDSDEEESDDDDEDKGDPLFTVKVQGQEFEVPLEELKAGYQRHADYTQKTQQVSDIYQRMSQWYEQRANDPEMWVQEIVGGQEDPAATIAGAILKTGEATTYTGQVLKHLVESGQIAEELVDALNLSHVAEEAKGQAVELKVQRLEQQLQQRDQQTQQQAEHQKVEQEIKRQWAQVASTHGLDVGDQDTFHRTLEFAHSRGIPNVEDAYLLMTSQAGAQAATAAPKAAKKKAKSAVKKRKTAAMSRKPTGGASPRGKGSSKTSDDPVHDAAAEALASLGLEE